MPELPEVESVLCSLRDAVPALPGRVVNRVTVLWDGLLSNLSTEQFHDGLKGMTFSAIRRHGKYLIFALRKNGAGCRESFLIVHLRMTGRLYLVPSRQAVERHTRMTLWLDEDLALRFDDPRKFGRVWLVADPDQVLNGLGPDALTVTRDVFMTRISATRRQIKPLLLDQSFLAGVGNIYADESLFRAGIHPLTPVSLLSERDLECLHGAVIEVLSEAVEAHGANIDGVFKEGGFIVSVYGRAGKPCFRCGSTIVKIRVAQRGTHLCPVCQPSV